MAFCVKCGAKIPDGATFCPSCGASQETQQVAVAQTKSHRELAAVLVLVGGVLGIISALFSMVMIPFFAGMMNYGGGMMGRFGFGMMGLPQFGMFFGGMMLAWSAVGLVGALLALYSGFKLRSDLTKSAATIGIIGGVLLLVGSHWLSGLVVLAGAILAYTD